jgi:uncharacterized protein
MTDGIVDAWMQHPTSAFVNHAMFEPLRRWTGTEGATEAPSLEQTIEAMDLGGVQVALASAWYGPEGPVIRMSHSWKWRSAASTTRPLPPDS